MNTHEKARIAIAMAIAECKNPAELILLAINLTSMAGVACGVSNPSHNPLLNSIAKAGCMRSFDAGIRTGYEVELAAVELAAIVLAEPTNSDIANFSSQLDAILKGTR